MIVRADESGEFLSTLPARGATPHCRLQHHRRAISIHAPREGSDRQQPRVDADVVHISIHAPREGSDPQVPPVMTETDISIHAPREGSDPSRRPPPLCCSDFYPRSPRGERRTASRSSRPSAKFLSTLPARGATWSPAPTETRWAFLSTLPARGATSARHSTT